MISIIIPLLDEEENIEILYRELQKELSKIGKSYEILFVDDGSTDNSLQILKNLQAKNTHIRIFSFRKNLGKAEALTFGFSQAKGEYIITLDADLQDRPENIAALLKKIHEGWDVVCGWRKKRKDSLPKIISSKIFNVIVGNMFGVALHDYNSGLKAYTKESAQSLRLYGGLHRFIPLLAHQQGFSITEIPVNNEKRKFGKSKYGFSKLWTELPDMFTMLFLNKYSKRPLHFFGVVGSLVVCIGLVTLIYLWMIQLQGHPIGRRPLLFFGMLCVLVGLQIFFTGFLADLILNISYTSQSPEENVRHYLRFSSDKKR